VTVYDFKTHEVVQGGTSLPDSPADDTAEARAHAREGTVPASPREVTWRDLFAVWIAARQGELRVLLDKQGTLLHAQPPTFHQAILRHHECASHYRRKPVRRARVAYGWGHTALIAAPLFYLHWATDSPLRLTIHAGLAAAVWAALILGGYL
jgi:hypothetical protein